MEILNLEYDALMNLDFKIQNMRRLGRYTGLQKKNK